MKKTILIALVCIACAIGSFLATYAAQPAAKQLQTNPPAELSIPSQDWSRACATDPNFPQESKALAESVSSARVKLAELLEDSKASDEAILAQVEQIIAIHDQFERRVAQHLLKIRQQLSADQQKQLMGLASESVRQGGYRWRGGRGPSTAPTTQESDRPGRKRWGRQGN